ncbi:integrase core domain-containing protein [Sphingomonas rubra]|uniref:Integrase core domain-containing protein n=1 Tax=Sphingomonas rubra TaxID=634430 RepID=A0A1I5UNU6_9SPHN|nr:integrase core domain-containing protein [Sphingomonas rubra]SFP96858.1 Integrase core domain-containing protein [Sphingomonas rubra]
MGQVRHGCATTTHAVRAAIQRSQASLATLSRELGINPKTVAKRRKRATVEDLKTGPKAPHSTTLSEAEEAVVVAFRRHTLLPLDDCLYALQPSLPHLTRSALHRCLQRHGISRLPDVEGDKPKRQRFKRYPIGFFHIDIAEVQTAEGKLYLFVGIDRTSKFAVNGQVERMNRTIKEATVKRFHYESHDQLRTHLADFMAAYNFARRLKTLCGLTPYEYIAKIWTSEPDRFIVDPILQMPGLNT